MCNIAKENIISELNKQQAVRNELIERRVMYYRRCDINSKEYSKDYKGLLFRIQETSNIIQKLKDKLQWTQQQ